MNFQYIFKTSILEYFRTNDPFFNMFLTTFISVITGIILTNFTTFCKYIKGCTFSFLNPNKKITVIIDYSAILKDKIVFNENANSLNNEIIKAVAQYLSKQNLDIKGNLNSNYYLGTGHGNLGSRKDKSITNYPSYSQKIIYNGNILYVSFEKHSSEKENIEKLYISSSTEKYIREFIDNVHYEWSKEKFKDKRFFLQNYRENDKSLFFRYQLKTNKTMNDLFFKDKGLVQNYINNYKNKKLSKLVFLLHGEPGTGKTSLIKAISNELSKDIISINLKAIKSDAELMNCFYSNTYEVCGGMNYSVPIDTRMIVIEDIDALDDIVKERSYVSSDSETKETKKNENDLFELIKPGFSTNSLTLSGILNCLDGIIEHEYVIIMTTNHPDKLDAALTRPGRITKKIHLTKITQSVLVDMLEYLYNTKLTSSQINNIPESPDIEPCKVEIMYYEGLSIDQVIDNIKSNLHNSFN